MTEINGVDDPAAVLAIPTEVDVEHVEQILQKEYERIEPAYVDDDPPESVATRGSLIQEFLGQLNGKEGRRDA